MSKVEAEWSAKEEYISNAIGPQQQQLQQQAEAFWGSMEESLYNNNTEV